MATHASSLAWKIPWREEPVGLSPQGHRESDMTEHASTHTRDICRSKIQESSVAQASLTPCNPTDRSVRKTANIRQQQHQAWEGEKGLQHYNVVILYILK